ncbi:competence type IV pilus major pilin ComGC [Bacillus marinisedimentorum]|uniref:competence type IV pilus major pilin ComGC n=1 Tax=Bacillus marinisedimentorum TaxID=1821260 RepID=UPI0009F6BFFC|nr:competence type IV pilus major pilin ComGC [Bacillus marinisedimentorum]
MREKGFTLVEMMIVLMIISILLMITIPNLTENNGTVREKGCEAMVKVAEAQVQAFEIKNKTKPANIAELVDGGYLTSAECPDGQVLSLVDGKIETSSP